MSEEITFAKIIYNFLSSLPATIAAIAGAIAAWAALRQSRRNAEKTVEIAAKTLELVAKTDENTALTEDTHKKAEELVKKAEENTVVTEKIHDQTNSNLLAVKAELATATKQIDDLRTLVELLSEKAKSGDGGAAQKLKDS